MTNEEIIDRVIGFEGLFSNHPADRGGATKFGITAATLGAWRRLGRVATAQEVRSLQQDEARAIYIQQYVTKPGFEKIKDGFLRYLVVDTAVHSGPPRAIRLLQRSVKQREDGILGPMTLAAVNYLDSQKACIAFIAQRLRFLSDLVARDPQQVAFLRGWVNRVTAQLEEVLV